MHWPKIGLQLHALTTVIASSQPSTPATRWRSRPTAVARASTPPPDHTPRPPATEAVSRSTEVVTAVSQASLDRFATTLRAGLLRFDYDDPPDIPRGVISAGITGPDEPLASTALPDADTVNTTATSSMPERVETSDWPHLSTHLRAEAALAEAYAIRENMTFAQAAGHLYRQTRMLDDVWLHGADSAFSTSPSVTTPADATTYPTALPIPSPTSSAISLPTSYPTSSPTTSIDVSTREPEATHAAMHLRVAVALYGRLQSDPTINARAAVAIAVETLESSSDGTIAVPSDEAIWRYHVNRVTDHLLPIVRDVRSMPPIELLRTVHAALALYFPVYHAPLADDRAIDIAATLRHRAGEPAHTSVGDPDIDPSYRLDVEAQIRASEDAAQMIPWEDFPPLDTRPWFDGMAINGAFGKQVSDLVKSVAAAQPDASTKAHRNGDSEDASPHPTLSAQTIEARIRRRLQDLQESARFPFGMPHQSIDTIVMRLAPVLNVTIADGDDFATVMNNFNRVCEAWSASPKYRISPSLSAALHLSRASGVVILHSGPAIPQHVQWTRARYETLRSLHDDPASNETLALWEQTQGETIWQALPRLADATDDPALPPLAQRIVKAYRHRSHATDVLLANTPAEAENRLLDYFHSRLHAYIPVPRFNEDRELLNMWQSEYGVSEKWLNTTRNFPCLINGDLLTGLKNVICRGSSLEELRIREDSIGQYRQMSINGHRFDAADERERALAHYRSRMKRDFSVLSQANEILRMSGKPFTEQDSMQMVRHLIEETSDADIRSGIDFFLKLLHSLTASNWLLHIARTIARGDPKEILGLLPFVIPAYEIEEGVRHGDAARALRGAVQFGADALMIWIGGKIDARLSLPNELPAISAQERVELSMLREGLETLGEPDRTTLPLAPQAERTSSMSQLASRSASHLRVPLRFAHLDERVRTGEIVPVDLVNVPNARMGYLPQENRVVPFARTASTIWELTWDGHIIGQLSDAQLGAVRESFWRAFPESRSLSLVTRESLPLRPTVAAAIDWIDRLAVHERAVEEISFLQATRVMRSIIDQTSVNDAKVAIFNSLSFMYRRSRTLRWLIAQSPRSRRELLQLHIEPGAEAAYQSATHTIVVPPLAEIEEIEYLSRAGPTTFRAESVWLHEFIHAITLLDDPARTLGAEHRGPVVYLTDRILYEANRIRPERIVYAGPSRRASQAQRALPEWRDQAQIVVHENLLLDERLATKVPIGPKVPVLGTPVKHRATVEAAVQIESRVLRALESDASPEGGFRSRLLRRLGPVYPIRGSPTPQIQWLRAFINNANTLYEANPWNRAFLDEWIQHTSGKRWDVQIRPLLRGDLAKLPAHVSMAEHSIKIATANTFSYLSATGPRAYSTLRRTASVLARIGTSQRLASAAFDAEFERGAVVYVEDKLLGLTAASEERRVSGQVWNVRPEACDADPTIARRAAADEDHYLETCKPDASGGCMRPFYMR